MGVNKFKFDITCIFDTDIIVLFFLKKENLPIDWLYLAKKKNDPSVVAMIMMMITMTWKKKTNLSEISNDV